ncbi:MAG: twin-arginine translocation signal domain-containing protein, partial [Salaquimonas sp.]
MQNLIQRRQFLKKLAASTVALSSGLALSFVTAQNAFAAVKKDISYGPNKLDIYSPANTKGAPVLAYVHGGAWKLGSKSKIGAKADYY